MSLAARIRLLEAQRIELLALLSKTASRLDALEAAIGGLVTLMHQAGQLERLWTCPRCGFLAARTELCDTCDGAGMEEGVDDHRS